MDDGYIIQLFEQARSFVDEGKHLHAIQVLQKLTRLAPHLHEPWIQLSRVYVQQRKLTAAMNILRQASEMTERPAELLVELARLQLEAGALNQAERSLQKAAAEERTLPPDVRAMAYHLLGIVNMHRGRFVVAEHQFKLVRQGDPAFPHINEALAETYLKQDRPVDAVEAIEKALTVEPDSWIAYYLLGLARNQQRRWRDAVNAFTDAIDRNPDEPETWHHCGAALLRLKQTDESEKYLKRALRLNPDLTDAIAEYGFVYLERGDVAHAAECFARALTNEPTHRRARDGQREVQRRMKNA